MFSSVSESTLLNPGLSDSSKCLTSYFPSFDDDFHVHDYLPEAGFPLKVLMRMLLMTS